MTPRSLTGSFLLLAILGCVEVRADSCATPTRGYRSTRDYEEPLRLIAVFQYLASPPSAPPAPPAPAPVAEAAPPAAPAAGPPRVRTEGARTPDVGLVKETCSRCHQAGGRTSGGVALFDAAGTFAPTVPPEDILDAVGAGRMPPSGLAKGKKAELLRALTH